VICSQPFYHLLVEVSDWSYDAAQPPVAYVAQELLAAPELEDEGASWGQVRCVFIC
jgi:heat shock protein HspQ